MRTSNPRELLRGLRPIQAKLILRLVEEDRSTFSHAEAAEMLGVSPSHLGNQLADLVQRGWLVRLGDGRYLVVPPEYGGELTSESNALALAVAAIPDGYIGWWNAASLHGLTTQVPYVITVGTLTRHRPRELAGSDVVYQTLPEHKYFGYTARDISGRQVNVSDHEKTVIDCLARPRHCGGAGELCRIVWGAAREIQWDTMLEYLTRFGSQTVVQRLGFILDITKAEIDPEIRSELKSRVGANSRSILGKKSSNEEVVGFIPEWGITVNYSQRYLLGDVPKIVRSQS